MLVEIGEETDSSSSFRPICLLDEMGKMLERIVSHRINAHLSVAGPDIAEEQFGFRIGRSTIDGVDRVVTTAQAIIAQGGVAVSVDIVNAFNSLPWSKICEALVAH
ncbi:hypothetical protein QLX08_005901 [Tetragonisca angustula]|uniref:Reverse transcriptase domain-containing protein n=1 Tax=Tetragonisca angustula TaxID=166442 RepID=A0AAW0ZZ66_9HYME